MDISQILSIPTRLSSNTCGSSSSNINSRPSTVSDHCSRRMVPLESLMNGGSEPYLQRPASQSSSEIGTYSRPSPIQLAASSSHYLTSLVHDRSQSLPPLQSERSQYQYGEPSMSCHSTPAFGNPPTFEASSSSRHQAEAARSVTQSSPDFTNPANFHLLHRNQQPVVQESPAGSSQEQSYTDLLTSESPVPSQEEQLPPVSTFFPRPRAYVSPYGTPGPRFDNHAPNFGFREGSYVEARASRGMGLLNSAVGPPLLPFHRVAVSSLLTDQAREVPRRSGDRLPVSSLLNEDTNDQRGNKNGSSIAPSPAENFEYRPRSDDRLAVASLLNEEADDHRRNDDRNSSHQINGNNFVVNHVRIPSVNIDLDSICESGFLKSNRNAFFPQGPLHAPRFPPQAKKSQSSYRRSVPDQRYVSVSIPRAYKRAFVESDGETSSPATPRPGYVIDPYTTRERKRLKIDDDLKYGRRLSSNTESEQNEDEYVPYRLWNFDTESGSDEDEEVKVEEDMDEEQRQREERQAEKRRQLERIEEERRRLVEEVNIPFPHGEEDKRKEEAMRRGFLVDGFSIELSRRLEIVYAERAAREKLDRS